MRLMSFSMTTQAYESCRKTVTRRLGWMDLEPDDVVMGCEKCMGLKRGEKVKRLHPFRTLSNASEPLMDIVRRPIRETGIPEVVLEGFPDLTPREFVDMFTAHNRCDPEDPVQRIEYKHLYNMTVAPRVIA